MTSATPRQHLPIEPCDPRELRVLRGLLSSRAACRWFEDMGIGWQIFKDRRCRVLATWALQHDCSGRPPLVDEVLKQGGTNERTMGEWLGFAFGHAAPNDPQHRQRLADRIAELAEAEGKTEDPDEYKRTAQRLTAARRALETYDELQERLAKASTPEALAAEAELAELAMKETCRELQGRWFPDVLREIAKHVETHAETGQPIDETHRYLARVTAFLAGEID